MVAIRSYCSIINKKLKSLTLNEYIILALVVSTFVSAFLLSALVLLLPVYFIATHQVKKALPKKKHEYALLFFSFIALISTFAFSKDAVFGDILIKAVWIKFLSIGIIILVFDIFFFTNIMTRRAFHISMVLSSLLSITSFIVALIQKILGIFPDPIERPGRVASIFFNENYYGTVIEFVVIIALFLLFKSTKRKARILYTLVIIVNIAGLYLSQCRTAYISIALSILVFTYFHIDKKQFLKILLVLFSFFLVIMLCSKIVDHDFLNRFDLSTLFNDIDFRIGIWKNAFHSIAEYPLLGRGYYAYPAVISEIPGGTHYWAIHAHNLFIELMMDFGLVGAIFLIVFCIGAVNACTKACKTAQDKTCGALILSAILSIVIHGMLDITVIFPQTGFFPVLLLTISQTYEAKENKGSY